MTEQLSIESRECDHFQHNHDSTFLLSSPHIQAVAKILKAGLAGLTLPRVSRPVSHAVSQIYWQFHSQVLKTCPKGHLHTLLDDGSEL